MSAKASHLTGLTSLRGIAALGIVVHHFVAVMFPDLWSAFIPTRFISKLYLFVDLFFVLSGFVLCHVYCGRFENGVGRSVYREYLLARFARIYPVHLFMLLLFVIYQGIYVLALHHSAFSAALEQFGSAHKRSWAGFVINVLLLQAIPSQGFWNEPAWSISAEWFAYLLIPFVVLGVRNAGPVRRGMIALACMAILVFIEVHFGDLGLWWGGWPLIVRCIAEATLGVVIYQWYLAGIFAQSAGGLATVLFILAVFSLALPIPHVISVLLFGALILAAAQIDRKASHWLNHPLLVYLGVISYSVYMVHWLVKTLIVETALWWWGAKPDVLLSLTEECLVVIAGALVVIGLSHLVYRRVELPWRARLLHGAGLRSFLGMEKTLS